MIAYKEGFRANCFRDFIMVRPWLMSMGAVALMGPFLLWLQGVFSYSVNDRLEAAWRVLYGIDYTGPLRIHDGKIIAGSYQPTAYVTVHGAPTVGTALLVAVMTVGVMLTALEKQQRYAVDVWMEPISRRASLHSKIAIGLGFVVAMAITRTAFVAITVAISPYHFGMSTVWFDGLLNLTISLVTLAVGMLAGAVMGNAFLGWSAGFVYVLFPMVLQTVMDFYHVASNAVIQGQLQRQVSVFDHLSPIMYTSMSTQERFDALHSQHSALVFLTSTQHPWLVAVGAICMTTLVYMVTRTVYVRQAAERSFDWITSPWGYRLTAAMAAVEFSCLVALMLDSTNGRRPMIAWPVLLVLSYLAIGLVKRIAEGRTLRRRTVTNM